MTSLFSNSQNVTNVCFLYLFFFLEYINNGVFSSKILADTFLLPFTAEKIKKLDQFKDYFCKLGLKYLILDQYITVLEIPACIYNKRVREVSIDKNKAS